MNVKRRNKAVATDTFSCDTAAVGSGAHMAQFFVGRESLFISIYGMKSGKEFVVDTRGEDRICKRGAMDKLISVVAPMKLVLKFSMSYATYALRIGKANPITNNKISLNAVISYSRIASTV